MDALKEMETGPFISWIKYVHFVQDLYHNSIVLKEYVPPANGAIVVLVDKANYF